MGTGTFLHGLDIKRWLAKPRAQRRTRRLRLVETLQLGERRFVAVLSVDGRELLIGATPHSLSLLSEINEEDDGLTPGPNFGRDVQ